MIGVFILVLPIAYINIYAYICIIIINQSIKTNNMYKGALIVFESENEKSFAIVNKYNSEDNTVTFKTNDTNVTINTSELKFPLIELGIDFKSLYEIGYRAHTGTSFSPEKRASSVCLDYQRELLEDLTKIGIGTESAKYYVEKYKLHLFNWLRSKSNCISTMITGGSNFPVNRAKKANTAEHNRLTDFINFRNNFFEKIEKEKIKIENADPDIRYGKIIKDINSTFVGINQGYSKQLLLTNLFGRLSTIAKEGDTELMTKLLDYIKTVNVKNKYMTERNKLYTIVEIAEANKKQKEVQSEKESTEVNIKGVNVVTNYKEDRIQLFFNGKPERNIIEMLKNKAFRWSPTNGCWQRKITNNAVYDTKELLSKI